VEFEKMLNRLERLRVWTLVIWVAHSLAAMIGVVLASQDGALSSAALVPILAKIIGYFAPQIALLYAFLFTGFGAKESYSNEARVVKRALLAFGLVMITHLVMFIFLCTWLYSTSKGLKLGVVPEPDVFSKIVDDYITLGGILFAALATAPLSFLFPKRSS
jgi:hypothetical protein